MELKNEFTLRALWIRMQKKTIEPVARQKKQLQEGLNQNSYSWVKEERFPSVFDSQLEIILRQKSKYKTHHNQISLTKSQ